MTITQQPPDVSAHGGREDRYLVLVTLPDMAAAVCLVPRAARPGGRAGGVPLVVLATLLAVVCATNLRPAGPRDGIPAWDRLVLDARAECRAQPGLTRVTIHIGQWPRTGWEALLPCERLR